MIQINQNQKMRFLIVVVLLKRPITILKSLKQKVKFQILIIQQQKQLYVLFENKIPSVSNLVKKTDYGTEVTEIENKLNNHNHEKYIDTSEFNKLAVDVFSARLAQANLITKTDFDAKLLGLNKKITQNKTKHLLIENELIKLKTFDSGYFIVKSHFEEDGTQNYLNISISTNLQIF